MENPNGVPRKGVHVNNDGVNKARGWSIGRYQFSLGVSTDASHMLTSAGLSKVGPIVWLSRAL